MSRSPSPARRVLRGAIRAVAVLVSLCALTGTVRLVVPTTAGTGGEPPGVRRQLTFLRAALDSGADTTAQGLFPEGYFFLNALYGLSWVDLGMREPVGRRAAALREARWAPARLDSDAAASPYLAAYRGQAWPVDSTVAMASLRLHDTLLPTRFGGTVERWLRDVRRHLDPGTGLLPHRADAGTGEHLLVVEGAADGAARRPGPGAVAGGAAGRALEPGSHPRAPQSYLAPCVS